jgi:dGTPase
MTLEGCVVKFADTIAYIGRDLQDAREVGLLDSSTPVPPECSEVLGSTNSEIINTLIYDLLKNSDSDDSGYISYSQDVEHALIRLREFSRRNIYENPRLISERRKITAMYEILFETCLSDIAEQNTSSRIYSDFLSAEWISDHYKQTGSGPEYVRDFIAGMTDRYFAKRFEEITIPRRVEGRFG